jgi:hypothetical protein
VCVCACACACACVCVYRTMGFTIENQEFVLPPKYVPLQQKLLGKGAYGQVCRKVV